MKNIFSKLISLLLLLCIVIGSLASCHLLPGGDKGDGGQTEQPKAEHIDYVSQVKFDLNSPTMKVSNSEQVNPFPGL